MDKELIILLEGHFDKEKIVSKLKCDSELFMRALELSVSDNYPFGWRGAWVVFHAMDYNDEKVRPYVRKIVKQIPEVSKDGHQRELMKVLSKMELDEESEGYMFDNCITIWETLKKSPSVRAMAFKMLMGIAEKYPELKGELGFLMQSHYLSTLSPGIKKSVENQYKRFLK
jgi:hypothetical protein